MNRPLRDPRGGRFRYSARRRSVLRRRWRRTVSENLLRFGSDRDAQRSEDGPLLTGRGRFRGEGGGPGRGHAAFVGGGVGHAELQGVDVSRALKMSGVLGIFTGKALAAGGRGAIPPAVALPGRGGRPMFGAAMPPLAVGRVRYVGEPVAIVVAETAAQARDAADAVAVDEAELSAASDVERALAPGAPVIWPEAPDNVALDWTDGDAAVVEMACARAAHVERVRLVDTRLAPAALEPRAAIGQWDAVSGRYTLIAGTQGVAVVRRMLAEFVFKVPAPQIRVLTYDVGGGFGMKTQPYAEYAALLYAARHGPYRGAGRPEALYLIERLLDGAARATGIDRVELRRRNFIAPSAMPYRAANGQVYDSGEFEAVLDKALALADWKGFPARRAASQRAGRLRGIGVACFLEGAGGILDETVDLRFEADAVTLRTCVQAMGAGDPSAYPRPLAARLGVDPSAVRLIQGG